MGPRTLGGGGLPRQKDTSIVPRPVSQTGFAFFYINVCGSSMNVWVYVRTTVCGGWVWGGVGGVGCRGGGLMHLSTTKIRHI